MRLTAASPQFMPLASTSWSHHDGNGQRPGRGTIRDVHLGALPPATFSDRRYLAVAAGGGLAAFALSDPLTKLATVITALDAAGLGLLAVTGASKSLALGLAPTPAVIPGAVTSVGGGTLRDALLGEVPTVLRRGL
jgi:uncharacterized membrane protein YeiH